MEKRSKHYLDIFLWVQRVIDSCETYPQTNSAYELIRYYHHLIERMGMDRRSINYLYNNLTMRLYEKKDEIIQSKLIDENDVN
jgi:hypothetical protein